MISKFRISINPLFSSSSLSPIFRLIVGLLTLLPFNLSIPFSILSMILVRDTLKPAEAIASNLVEASTVLTSFFDLPEGICNSSIPVSYTHLTLPTIYSV